MIYYLNSDHLIMKFLEDDLNKIKSNLQELGYFFKCEVIVADLNDNKVDIEYNVKLGEKAKIKIYLLK